MSKLDSNTLQMDRTLSAQQIRAARGLLGWSRRELALVAGVSQGTIKAIEQGTTDVRISTLRKLAQTFAAHDIQFIADGPWTGAVVRKKPKVETAYRAGLANPDMPSEATMRKSASGLFRWIEPLRGTAGGRKA
jgi:transcriptional regulator with XRE-family HTH domain